MVDRSGAFDAFEKHVKRRVRPHLQELARDVFQEAKDIMIQEVLSHPVSVELSQRTGNSKFLSGARGSLYGFLGFNDGYDPISHLVNYLRQKVKFKPGVITGRKGDIRLNTIIEVPSNEDFNKDGRFRLPWESGKSWPIAVETGVSGLPYYLNYNVEGVSRSGGGIQIKSRRKGRFTEFAGTSYLTPIFKEFRVRVIGR